MTKVTLASLAPSKARIVGIREDSEREATEESKARNWSITSCGEVDLHAYGPRVERHLKGGLEYRHMPNETPQVHRWWQEESSQH